MKRRNLNEKVLLRFRALIGLIMIASTPFVTYSAILIAKAERVNENAIGGEALVPVFLLLLALFIIPEKYKVITIRRNVSEEVSVIDMSSAEVYNEEVISDSGFFNIIDNEGVNHLIRVSRKYEE